MWTYRSIATILALKFALDVLPSANVGYCMEIEKDLPRQPEVIVGDIGIQVKASETFRGETLVGWDSTLIVNQYKEKKKTSSVEYKKRDKNGILDGIYKTTETTFDPFRKVTHKAKDPKDKDYFADVDKVWSRYLDMRDKALSKKIEVKVDTTKADTTSEDRVQ
jgi:hypothetical protein